MASAVNVSSEQENRDPDRPRVARRNRGSGRAAALDLEYLQRPSYCDAAFALDQISEVHLFAWLFIFVRVRRRRLAGRQPRELAQLWVKSPPLTAQRGSRRGCPWDEDRETPSPPRFCPRAAARSGFLRADCHTDAGYSASAAR
ncbi:hypothetical protein AOLI_G00078140 [Acnodon oligacanthus]